MLSLRFDNRFVAELPGDPEERIYPRGVHDACWSRTQPTPVKNPRLIASSKEMACELGISPQELSDPELAQILAGNKLLPGMTPYSACYGGYQFGNWAGQLGDGRAITLGEVVTAEGKRWELQLKGAGLTAYSRRGDGRAVLRSSIREFLCSEAMYHLGVPTTRALALVATGEQVIRDMFYDGRPKAEPGAIVCRVAPSFIRFGNFEIFNARRNFELLAKLVDFTINRDFPWIERGEPEKQRALWFEDVCIRTARLAVEWMRVGFVHGVLNTDNMSILGLTIDYGPYGWIDNYDPDWTPNTTDAGGRRYRFGAQPAIAHWNLQRLAEAIAPLFSSHDALEAGLERYVETYNRESEKMMARKFGFSAFSSEDEELVREVLQLMRDAEVDMTFFFRELAADVPTLETLAPAFYRDDLYTKYQPAFASWLERYQKRLGKEPEAALVNRRSSMNAVNPRFVLRNYLAQEAIDAAEQQDTTLIDTLLEVLRRPYDEQPEHARFAAKRPDWARDRAGCSMLSCSS